jgi:membrane protein DedA with SNARE-associated domain
MSFGLVNLSSLGFLPYFILGLFAMLEGPIALLAGGAASSSGLLLPLPVYISVVLGNLIADMGWYSLGRFGKLDWLTRLGTKFRVDQQRINELEKGIRINAPRLLFLSKFTVGFPIPTLIATGLGHVPVRRWVGWVILGELIKSAALIGVGYIYAQMIQQVSITIQLVLWGITAVIFLAGIVWYKWQKRRSRVVLPGLRSTKLI